MSLAWTGGTDAHGPVARYDLPSCAIEPMTGYGQSTNGEKRLSLYAPVAIVRGSCHPAGPVANVVRLRWPAAQVHHDHPGIVVGRMTSSSPPGLSYFDGREHTIA